MSDLNPATPPLPEEQLEAIHAMLRAGHRGIRIERHSLVLWGITGSVLMAATPRLFTRSRFPGAWEQAGAELGFLAAAIALVTAVDLWLTRRSLRRQGESLPFVQRQVGKVWLLLVGLGLLATFGAHFHGGGAMLYPLWMLLLGTGLFTHGLFSGQLLEWSGATVIVLGVGVLGLQLPVDAARWLAVVVFGAGLPTLGLALPFGERRAMPIRLGLLLAWAVAMVALSLVAFRAVAWPDETLVDAGGWREVRLGMSVERTRAALGRMTEGGVDRLELRLLASNGRVQIHEAAGLVASVAGLRVEGTTFTFLEGELSKVHLQLNSVENLAPPGTVDRLRAALATKYGRPARVSPGAETRFGPAQAEEWVVAGARITLRTVPLGATSVEVATRGVSREGPLFELGTRSELPQR